MPTVRGWTTAQLIDREKVFDGLISKAIRMSLRRITADMSSIIIASSIDEFAQGAVTATWVQYVDNELQPYLVETFMDSAANVLGGMETALDVSIPKITEGFAQEYLASAPNRLKGIGDAVWVQVRASLQEGVSAGEDMQQLATRVRKVAQVPHVRASVIARTEVHGAAEQGALAQVQLGGFTDDECSKVWLATDDTRTRDEHDEADGQKVGINQPFIVWGEGLQFPGDPTGRAENVIQCRCSMAFEFADDEPTTAGTWTQIDEHKHPRDNRGRFRDADEFDLPSVSPQQLQDEMFVGKAKDNLVPLSDDTVKMIAEIYTFSHGDLRTDDVEVDWHNHTSGAISISGTIYDARGRDSGSFGTTIKIADNGRINVIHEELMLNPKIQGMGFATAFNERTYAWYRSINAEKVSLLANSDVGGLAWALAGYDWKDDDLDGFIEMQDRIDRARSGAQTMPNGMLTHVDKIPAERREEQFALAQRLWDVVGGSVDDDTSFDDIAEIKDRWPIPYEIANLGRWEGAGKSDTWIGKIIMKGSNWWGDYYLDD